MKDMEINEVRELEGERFRCIKGYDCGKCAFDTDHECENHPFGECAIDARVDKTSTVFVRVVA